MRAWVGGWGARHVARIATISGYRKEVSCESFFLARAPPPEKKETLTWNEAPPNPSNPDPTPFRQPHQPSPFSTITLTIGTFPTREERDRRPTTEDDEGIKPRSGEDSAQQSTSTTATTTITTTTATTTATAATITIIVLILNPTRTRTRTRIRTSRRRRRSRPHRKEEEEESTEEEPPDGRESDLRMRFELRQRRKEDEEPHRRRQEVRVRAGGTEARIGKDVAGWDPNWT